MMRVLIVGSDGFIGRDVKELLAKDHEVYGAQRKASPGELRIDLLKPHTIAGLLRVVRPEVIINCAGIVGGSNEEVALNPVFTENILKEAIESKLALRRIIILGSAAEYGVMDKKYIPVTEDAPRSANSGYGLSKKQEVDLALTYADDYGLPVTVARIFNPIGAGMREKFLVPAIIRQVKEVRAGTRQSIEVGRLDAGRDYIDCKDMSQAIRALIDNEPKERVYNIGSGTSTSNGELVDLILNNSKLIRRPEVVETSAQPEPLVAVQADITRITEEFGWKPLIPMRDTIRKIMNDAE